jgi:predicted patatin/cPLA2 family phospholipase
MENGILFQTTIGISAGAMSGIAYQVGKIGWSARWNLNHRMDPEYFGLGAFRREHGISGFSYFFENAGKEEEFDRGRFFSTDREFIVGATDCRSGKIHYFRKNREKDRLHFDRVIAASSSVPYISEPVTIDGVPYLDGSCAMNIPYHLALRLGKRKDFVLKTQHRAFRAKVRGSNLLASAIYRKSYPNLLRALQSNHQRYNEILDEIALDEAQGRIFVLAPSTPVAIGNFERDLGKLSDLYWQGYRDMSRRMEELRTFLA